MRRLLPAVFVVLLATPAFAVSVAFVDNQATAGGDGSPAKPFRMIAQASDAAAIYVAGSPQPYVENVTLRAGQMLIGSAYGLDAVAAEMQVTFDAPPTPAAQGTAPTIQGSISVFGDNVIAGCIVRSTGPHAIGGFEAQGRLTLRDVFIRIRDGAWGIWLQRQHGPVSVVGGGIEASSQAYGVYIFGGEGEVVFDHFPISGSFVHAVHITSRDGGAVTFRNKSPIRTEDTRAAAFNLADLGARSPVTFDRVDLHGHEGISARRVAKVSITGGGSRIETSGGPALTLRDCGLDVVLDSVSAEGGESGIVLDKIHGRLEVNGGTVHAAGNYGVSITQSTNVRLTNVTINASGTKDAKCSGDVDVNTTVACNAALYLRHVEQSSFENVVIDGSGAIGVNGNNLNEVKFDGLKVSNSGEKAGVLLQDSRDLQFVRCRFADNAATEVLFEQRFTRGHVVFQQCRFEAPATRKVTPHLLTVDLIGLGFLAIDIQNGTFDETAGDGVNASLSGNAGLALTIADTTMQRTNPPLVAVTASESSSACIDLPSNLLMPRGPNPIRLAARGPLAKLQLASIPADATIDAPEASVSHVTSCR